MNWEAEAEKGFERLPREQQLDQLLREVRFWLWSYDTSDAALRQMRDKMLDRVERVLDVNGKKYTVSR